MELTPAARDHRSRLADGRTPTDHAASFVVVVILVLAVAGPAVRHGGLWGVPTPAAGEPTVTAASRVVGKGEAALPTAAPARSPTWARASLPAGGARGTHSSARAPGAAVLLLLAGAALLRAAERS